MILLLASILGGCQPAEALGGLGLNYLDDDIALLPLIRSLAVDIFLIRSSLCGLSIGLVLNCGYWRVYCGEREGYGEANGWNCAIATRAGVCLIV